MKTKKIFSTILLALTSVMAMAMSFPTPQPGHLRTIDEPYQEFIFCYASLWGVDNYLVDFELQIGERNGKQLIRQVKVPTEAFIKKDDEWELSQPFINTELYRDSNYVVIWLSKTGGYEKYATLRVYRRHNPLEDFSARLSGTWVNNWAATENFEEWLDFTVADSLKTELSQKKLQVAKSKAYLVSPKKIVMDGQFGDGDFHRYFEANGRADNDSRYYFKGKMRHDGNHRYSLDIDRTIGLYGISNPLKLSLVEQMEMGEYCVHTHEEQVITTQTYAQPTKLNFSTDQYQKHVRLTWQMKDPRKYDVNNEPYIGKWYVYQRKTGTTTWEVVNESGMEITKPTDVFTYEDTRETLEYSTPYDYCVTFIPNYWLEYHQQGGTITPENYEPSNELSVTVNNVTINLSSPLIGSPQAIPQDEGIAVVWNHQVVPETTYSGFTPKFIIQRRSDEEASWTTISEIPVTDLRASKSSETVSDTIYDQKDIVSSCMGYSYNVLFDRGDNVSVFSCLSPTPSTRITGGSKITKMEATTGSFTKECLITWYAEQVGTAPTTYEIRRRDISSDKSVVLTKKQGTSTSYSHLDATCEPGRYYEYTITAYTDCEGSLKARNSLSAFGFSRSYGTISGMVTYGAGGEGVDSVRVSLTPNSHSEGDRKFYYSAHFSDKSYGIQVPVNNDRGLKTKTFESDYTIAAWVKPDSTHCNLFTILGKDQQHLTPYIHADKLLLKGFDAPSSSPLTVAENRWTFVFLTRSGNSITLGTIDDEGKILRNQFTVATPLLPHTFAVGIQKRDPALADLGAWIEENHGAVSIDEVRVYRHALSNSELLRSYDRMLSGREKDLMLYWPMNEGHQTGNIYDLSTSNDAPNNAHGSIKDGMTYIEDSPNQTKQVTCYGITQEDGTYIINGIPFAGVGTNYDITPSKGIHVFSDRVQSRFVSPSSLVYNSVNFIDHSYFPVSGTVRYAGTTIPVDSCTFEVDGVTCMSNGIPVMTDAKGKYTISVPVGNHQITIKRNNHVFVNDGKYPAGNTTRTFNKELYNVDFVDTTLVNFVGRIVGGFRDQDEPVGFQKSTNNIGKVQFYLTPTVEGYINAKKVVSGTTYAYEFNHDTVSVASDTTSIKSWAYRGGGSAEECKRIYITTDPATGEFSAMIPPLNYKMSEQKIVNKKTDNKIGEVRIVNLSDFIYAGIDTISQGKDSLANLAIYKYHYKYIADYHTPPVFKVNEGKPFGIKTYKNTEDGVYTIEDIYSVNGGKISYKFGYPMFVTGQEYAFDIEAYESYVNADDPSAKPDQQPLSGCGLKITNALASSQALAKGGQKAADGTVVEEGTPIGKNFYGMRLDSLGKATYLWCAGMPNFNAKLKHALSFNIELVVSGKYYKWTPSDDAGLWRADDTKTGPGMKGINLGAINKGKNFTTKGPDKVLMVLRDPPGAKSSATWCKGSSTSLKKETLLGGGGSGKLDATKMWGTKACYIYQDFDEDFLEGTFIEKSTVHQLNAGFKIGGGRYDTDISTTTVTTTEDISTSSSPEYVGSWGDVYVGTAGSFIFGDAREVYLKPNDQGIAVRDVQGVRDSIETTFTYTQGDIISTILPGYKNSIRSLLKDTYGIPRKTRGEVTVPHYYSNLPETDSRYGLSNFDKVFNGAEVKDGVGPSYTVVFPNTGQHQDTIQYMHNQIKIWENVIKENEKEKVMMFENRKQNMVLKDNFSFDGGAEVNLSYTTSTDSTRTFTVSGDETLDLIINDGGKLNVLGLLYETTLSGQARQSRDRSKTTMHNETFSVTLSDNNYCDHTIDVYRKREEAKKQGGSSLKGWGPVFRTLAGHTYGPYEDGDTARYYGTNKELMAKTIQMEVPQLIVDQPLQNQVPNGGVASFKVKLSNLSYTESSFLYLLGYKPDSNKGNAEISVDGKSIRDGLGIFIPYNVTVEKVVTIKQTDKSILNYDDIELYLRSSSQNSAQSHWPVIESVVPISAHFVPVSTDVTLQVDKSVLNTSTDTTLVFTISDFDIHHERLKNVQLQYRFANEEWVTLQTWVTDTKAYPQHPSLAEEAAKHQGLIKYELKMKAFADGDYTFRAVSATQYGTDGEVTKESAEMSVVKDTKRPSLIAMPTPVNGILDIGDVISAEFNKDIASGKITQDDHMEVYGSMAENSNSYHVGVTGQTDFSTIMETQSRIELRNEPFTIEMWSRNDGDGYSLAFGTNKLNLGLVLGSLPSVVMGGNALSPNPQEYTFTHTASEQLDMHPGEWVFWQFTYKPADKTVADSKNVISLTAFYGDKTKTVFKNVAIPNVTSNSKMAVGVLNTGQYADLAIWDHVRGPEKAAMDMKRKSGLEEGLSHYWKFNEGHGTVARDLVGGNNINLPEHAWFIDNTNFAAHIERDKHLAIPMGDSNLSDDDSYALDFWFKVDKDAFGSKSSLPIMSTANGAIVMSVRDNGYLTLTTKHENDSCTYESVGTFSNDWQHVLLNVQRGISASLFVDGTNQMMLEEKKTPGLTSDSIYFGKGFSGDIDEIRIWRGLHSTLAILDERYNMIDTTVVHELVRYYPFENTTLDEGNQRVTAFSLHNAAEPNGVTVHDMKGDMVKAATTPPLKDAVKRSNLPFTFTASERVITIQLDESVLRKMEGQTINIKLKDVPDINGNHSGKFSWNTFVRRNPLRWTDTGNISLQVQQNTPEIFEREICNHGSKTVNWLLKTPVWLEASSVVGSLEPQEKTTIFFTTTTDIPTGVMSDNIELTNIDYGMTERIDVSLKVIGFKPLWAIDYSDKEFSIPLTARLILDNAFSEDEEDMLAAFVGNECVGIGNVQYNNQRDNYYVNMNIYGGNNQLGRSITFKAWDADRNIVFAPMTRMKDGNLKFSASATPYGSYDSPELFSNGEQVEQVLDLDMGWNWVSFFVSTRGMSLSNALSAADGIIQVVKTQNAGAVWNPELSKQGVPYGFMSQKLKNLNQPSMYAIYATEPVTLSISGKLLKGNEGRQVISQGWNWLRNPYHQNQAVSSAFSDLSPYEGDVLQGRNNYAQWNATYKQWDGMMTSFAAGQGYKYFNGDHVKKVIFGDISNNGTNTVLTAEEDASADTSYGYVNNMLLLAKVMLKEEAEDEMDSIVLVATNGHQQTFQTLPDRGYYVLAMASDDQRPFTFQAVMGGKTIPLYAFVRDEDGKFKETSIVYEADAIAGTFVSPVILSDDRTITGISDVVVDHGMEEIYNIQGQLLYRGKADEKVWRRLPRGTYIVNGQKVIR